jgi:regulatory protein spx
MYVSPSCTSCRKAKRWFEERNIPYTERNLLQRPLQIDELRHILSLSLEGTEEIVSTRSKVYRDMNIDIEELTLKELVELLRENPSMLRKPLVIDEKRLLIGYNEEEIRVFLPRTVRMLERQHMQLLAGI